MSVRDECGNCGEPIVGYSTHGSNKQLHWYHVASNNPRCPPPHRGWARPKPKGENT